MSVTVNGVAVAVADNTTPAFAATRELLRQQAVALEFLGRDETDQKAIDGAIENLLAREVVTPDPTEAEKEGNEGGSAGIIDVKSRAKGKTTDNVPYDQL